LKSRLCLKGLPSFGADVSNGVLTRTNFQVFQRGRQKLDKDLKFFRNDSEQVLLFIEWQSQEKKCPFRFHGIKSLSRLKVQYWLKGDFGKMADNLVSCDFSRSTCIG